MYKEIKTIGIMTDFEKLFYDIRKYLLFLENILISAENRGLVERIVILI